MVYCRKCGKEIYESADVCIYCGADQQVPRYEGKNKIVAGLLAIFLGGLGIHRFYLGQWWGIFYLLFCWTLVPFLIAFIEGIVFLLTGDETWNKKYGSRRRLDDNNKFVETLDRLHFSTHPDANPPKSSSGDDDS